MSFGVFHFREQSLLGSVHLCFELYLIYFIFVLSHPVHRLNHSLSRSWSRLVSVHFSLAPSSLPPSPLSPLRHSLSQQCARALSLNCLTRSFCPTQSLPHGVSFPTTIHDLLVERCDATRSLLAYLVTQNPACPTIHGQIAEFGVIRVL